MIADWVAETVTDILEQNIQAGTGTGAAIGRPAAGKTGTTEEHSDAWFCGYTPNLSTTVWVGYPQGEIPMTSVHGISVAGGTFPAQIWRLFMGSALDGTREWEFAEAKNEPIWHEFTRGQYAGEVSSYRSYTPPPPTTTTQAPAPKPKPPPPPTADRPASAATSGRPASAAATGRAASAAGSQAAASAAAASWLAGDACLSPRSRRGLPCWRS